MSEGYATEATEELLAQVPLFAGLERKERRKLADACLLKTFPEGALIVEEGKPGLGLFIILDGEVDVYHGSGEGKRVVGQLRAGGILGEMSLVDNQPRSASAEVVKSAQCLMITRDRFQALVRNHAEIAWCIVPVLAQRFRKAEAMVADLMQRQGGAPAEPAGAPQAADEAAPAQETAAEPEAKPARGLDTERLLDALRAEYALLLAGTEALSRGAGIMETFLGALARETELDEQDRLRPLLRAFPKALRIAMADALEEGERMPERVLSRFRRELKRR